MTSVDRPSDFFRRFQSPGNGNGITLIVVTHRILVGILALILATCSSWCTRLHYHGAGLVHADCDTAGAPGQGMEAPRPVNDDNCACSGALVPFGSVLALGFSVVTPLPLDHPFAIAIVWPAAWMAAGLILVGPGETNQPVDTATAALRALRLRC